MEAQSRTLSLGSGLESALTRGSYTTMLSPQGHGGFGVAERMKGVFQEE